MHLMVLGVNHKTAPISVREKLTLDNDNMLSALKLLLDDYGIFEAMLISTCNRSELYVVNANKKKLLIWLQRVFSVNIRELVTSAYIYEDKDAVNHLFTVACGLDSMILGETQILGQLKRAYKISHSHKFIGKVLGKLCQNSFAVAKKVRTNTKIGVNSVSVANIAVQLANNIFSNITTKKILIIGAGETASIVLKHLYSVGGRNITIANRTLEKCSEIARNLEASDANLSFIGLEEIPDTLIDTDMVISSTQSPLPIIGKGMIERALRLRKHRMMFLLDLAVPRDIEEQVKELSDVYHYCIDDLQEIAHTNRKSRESAALAAREIIDEEVSAFMRWMFAQDSIEIIMDLRNSVQEHRDKSLQEALRQIEAGHDAKSVIEKMAWVMFNRIMHQPTVELRKASTNGEAEVIHLVRKLFKLSSQ